MKEAFWGVLIVMLGLFGIVVVNLFQKVTIENDRVYYVIKEATEASMYDAVDLSTYRLTGKLRMVEDKFVENLTRRFAQNVSLGNYTITVQEINETPPYVSVMVKSNITSLKGEEFRISNDVTAILETKYTLDELLEFLDVTEEEWNTIQKGENKNACDVLINQDDYECISKDLKFGEWGDVSVSSNTCSSSPSIENKKATVTYHECECGKWVEKTEEINSIAINTGSSIDYTWNFNKDGELRSINETMIRKTKLDECTTGVSIMVPSDLKIKEPSTDNSKYVSCGTGIRIPSGTEIVLHGEYEPKNATNRTLTWSKNGDAFALSFTNTSISNNSYSRAILKAGSVDKGEIKSSIVTTKTTLNQEANCNITVWDGSVDTVGCQNLSLNISESKSVIPTFTPYNSTRTDFTYSVGDTNIASINGNTVSGKKAGTTTIKVTDKYTGKTGECSLTVNIPPPVSVSYNGGNCSCTGNVFDKSVSYPCEKKTKVATTKRVCVEKEQSCEKYFLGLFCINWSIPYCTKYENVTTYTEQTYIGTCYKNTYVSKTILGYVKTVKTTVTKSNGEKECKAVSYCLASPLICNTTSGPC